MTVVELVVACVVEFVSDAADTAVYVAVEA